MAETKAPRLQPSKAGLWLVCAGMPALAASVPRDSHGPRSKDAMWGDAAHAVLARSLLEKRSPASFVGESIIIEEKGVELKDRTFVINEEDAANVNNAYQYALTRMSEYGTGTMVLIEERVDAGEAFHVRDEVLETNIPAPLPDTTTGDVDIALVGGGFLEVIDYKNGYNYVDHINNPDMVCYALGVIKQVDMATHPVQKVRLTIVQPRAKVQGGFTVGEQQTLNPNPLVRTWELSLDELMEWAVKLGTAAHATRKPDAPRNPGPWCTQKYCPARAVCPELTGKATAILTGAPENTHVVEPLSETGVPDLTETPSLPHADERSSFGPDLTPGIEPDQDLVQALVMTPDQMTVAQRARIVEAGPMIRSWLDEVEKHSFREMMQGVRYPGLKLVLGRRSKAWNLSEEEMRQKFSKWNRIGDDGKAAGKLKQEHYLKTTLLSPAQATSTIKPMVTERTWKTIESFIDVKDGKPTIAPATDSRPEHVVKSAQDILGVKEQGEEVDSNTSVDVASLDFLR